MICQHERVLELQWDGPLVKPSDDTHYFYRPTAKARRVPAILHAFREARSYILDYQKIYKLVNFSSLRHHHVKSDRIENQLVPNDPVNLYYNPAADIPFFGFNTCMITVVDFIEDMKIKKLPVTKIAILCSGALTECHDWFGDEQNIIHGPDEYACFLGHEIAGGCSPMEALHSIPQAIAWNEKAPGLPGLKEVIWIVETKLMAMKGGQIPNIMGMRDACSKGLTKGQENFISRIEEDIDLVKIGKGLPRLQGDNNRWAGDAMPNFYFQSLCPLSLPGDKSVYDAIVIDERKLHKLCGANSRHMNTFRQTYQCDIRLAKQDYPGQKLREIGFRGLPGQVEKAKKGVIEHVENWEPVAGRSDHSRDVNNKGSSNRGRGRGQRGGRRW